MSSIPAIGCAVGTENSNRGRSGSDSDTLENQWHPTSDMEIAMWAKMQAELAKVRAEIASRDKDSARRDEEIAAAKRERDELRARIEARDITYFKKEYVGLNGESYLYLDIDKFYELQKDSLGDDEEALKHLDLYYKEMKQKRIKRVTCTVLGGTVGAGLAIGGFTVAGMEVTAAAATCVGCAVGFGILGVVGVVVLGVVVGGVVYAFHKRSKALRQAVEEKKAAEEKEKNE